MELKKEITILISDIDHNKCHDWCLYKSNDLKGTCDLGGKFPSLAGPHEGRRSDLCKALFNGVHPEHTPPINTKTS